MPVVRMPDGTQVSFPDDMPADQIRSLIQGKFPDAVAQTAPATPVAPVDVPLPKPAPQAKEVSSYPLQPEVQGAGRGLAALGGMADMVNPVGVVRNVASAAKNLLPEGYGRETAANVSKVVGEPMQPALVRAATNVAESAGVPVADYSNGTLLEQLRTNTADLGVQAVAGSGGLLNAARVRGAEIAGGSLPRAFDSFLRPYMSGNVAPTLVGDAAATVGGAAGKTAVDQTSYKGNPLAEAGGILAGGVGSLTAVNTVAAGSRALAGGIRRQFGLDVAPVPIDPATNMPVSMQAFDSAATRARASASYPDESAARMQANAAELRALDPNAPMPSPAALAEDPGLARLEGVVNRMDPGAAMARQREFATGVRDTIDRTAPDGADPAALVKAVRGEADMRMARANAAEDNVAFDANAAQRAAEAETLRREGQARDSAVQSDNLLTTTLRNADEAARASEAEIAQREGRRVQLEGREERIADVRARQGEFVRQAGGREAQASQNLDAAIVDQGYLPARAEKNRQFDNAPGRGQQLPADDVIQAAKDVLRRSNALRPDEQLPSDFVTRLRQLEPRFVKNEETGAMENMGGPGTAMGGDLADTRKYLSTAIERARSTGNFEMADSLQTLRAAINRTIEEAPGYSEANRNYQQFADTYRPGPGDAAADFTRAIDRDGTRSKTPPSQTAGRFLQEGQPERHAALARMINAAENPLAGQAAAREYLLADMAPYVVDARTGALRPDRLRQWQERWGDLSGVVPGFQREINEVRQTASRGVQAAERAAGMTERASDAVKSARQGARDSARRSAAEVRTVQQESRERAGQYGEYVDAGRRAERDTASRFADELRTAQKNTKATEDEINKGALGLVLNADVDKTVAAIMSQPNRTGRLLDELITTIGSDQQAKNGLKAAVRDFLIEKATTGASEKLKPGDRRGPVSQAKLSAIFKEHEREMAKVFDPDEMNTLRAGHRALELANIERLRTGSGSDTTEKAGPIIDQLLSSPLGRGVEAALRIKYGLLKAGGLVSTARRLTAGATGGPDPVEVSRLLERASVDPELMGLLLGRKVPVASPAWNAKLQQLLALKEASDTD